MWLLGVVVLLAVFHRLAPWIALGVTVWACVKAFRWARQEIAHRNAALEAAHAALIARCDEQHAWVLADDPRGTFGAP